MAIVPIVEGHGELESVPVLLNRLGIYEVARPFRVKRQKVVKAGELERAITQAIRDRPGASAVLILLDADDDCPAELGAALRERASATTHLPVSVVLANREIEAWFLAALPSLREVRGIRADAEWSQDPEQPRNAKGRLEQFMVGRTYLDVDDQPALMARFDMGAARQSSGSLDKLLRDLESMGYDIASALEN